MFQLSDKTRRPVCLAIFFLACVLPTLCVFAWGVSRSGPWHASNQAKRLGQRLGVEVSLEAVLHPRPGVVVYKNLELSNPETGATMLHCDRLRAEWTRSDETTESGMPCLVLIASRSQIDAAEKDALWPLVQRILAREVGSPGIVRLEADRVEVRRSESASESSGAAESERASDTDVEDEPGRQSPAALEPSHTLIDVRGKVDTFDQWMQAELTFHAARSGSVDQSELVEPSRIRVRRDRQVGRPFTSFDLDTGGQGGDHPDPAAPALPCCLLGLALEPFVGLGPESRFRGYISASVKPHGHDGWFRGQFLDVDLDRLVTDRFQDRLSGKANLTVQFAQFHQGGLLNVDAEIDVRDGVISAALLRRAVVRLGLEPLDSSYDLRTEQSLSFKQIAASFVLDGGGLQSLHGTCVSTDPNTILEDNLGPFLGDPPPLNVSSLADVVRMLVPESASAAYETARLMVRLPMSRRQTTLR